MGIIGRFPSFPLQCGLTACPVCAALQRAVAVPVPLRIPRFQVWGSKKLTWVGLSASSAGICSNLARTSRPPTTRPNTVCFPSKCFWGLWKMNPFNHKNERERRKTYFNQSIDQSINHNLIQFFHSYRSIRGISSKFEGNQSQIWIGSVRFGAKFEWIRLGFGKRTEIRWKIGTCWCWVPSWPWRRFPSRHASGQSSTHPRIPCHPGRPIGRPFPFPSDLRLGSWNSWWVDGKSCPCSSRICSVLWNCHTFSAPTAKIFFKKPLPFYEKKRLTHEISMQFDIQRAKIGDETHVALLLAFSYTIVQQDILIQHGCQEKSKKKISKFF